MGISHFGAISFTKAGDGTAAKATPLSASVLPVKAFIVQALSTNTSALYLGGSAVSATAAPTVGVKMNPADVVTCSKDKEVMGVADYDLSQFYFSAVKANEGVTVTYVQ